MKEYFLIIFLSLLIFTVFGCENKKEEKPNPTIEKKEQNVLPPQEHKSEITKHQQIDKKTEQEILAVINENLDATRKEDEKGVLKTIHSKSPQRSSTINGMDFVFKNYDMEYKLDLAEVLEVFGDTAVVHYVQTTKAIKGQGFANNTSEGIHLLIKENGNWKIYRTDPLK